MKPAVTKIDHVHAQRCPHGLPPASFPSLLPLDSIHAAHLLDFGGDLHGTENNRAIFAPRTPP